MAHYAKLDENNIVLDVIVLSNNDCLDDDGNECEEKGRQLCEELTGYAKWKKTSLNTRLGVHFDPETGEESVDQSKAFRLNYAIVGMIYDESIDGFINLRPLDHKKIPCNSWNLNVNTGHYEPPTQPPKDGRGLKVWDETTTSWI
jgi:hypothetical protein